eukprot:gene26386-32365_t
MATVTASAIKVLNVARALVWVPDASREKMVTCYRKEPAHVDASKNLT